MHAGDGLRPIHRTSLTRTPQHLEALRALLAAGADPRAVEGDAASPLADALRRSAPEVALVLLRAGARLSADEAARPGLAESARAAMSGWSRGISMSDGALAEMDALLDAAVSSSANGGAAADDDDSACGI